MGVCVLKARRRGGIQIRGDNSRFRVSNQGGREKGQMGGHGAERGRRDSFWGIREKIGVDGKRLRLKRKKPNERNPKTAQTLSGGSKREKAEEET